MKTTKTSLAFIFAASVCLGGTSHSQDACEYPTPPPADARPCDRLPNPADLDSPDHSYIDTMIEGAPGSYASKSHPNLCIDNSDEKTVWKEKKIPGSGDLILERQALFQRPKYSRNYKLPLIIWAHPTGQSEIPAEPTYIAVGEAALKNGFAFLSIEFRHPTASRPDPGPPPQAPPQNQNGDSYEPFCAWPSTDIAVAIQWARQHATQLQIDREAIYVVGQSRGSLGLLTAYMPDQKDPQLFDRLKTDYRGHSSKPRAVFMAQAQVTYIPSQLRQIFLRQKATRLETDGDASGDGIADKVLQFPLCKYGNPAVFDYHCHWSLADKVINPRTSNLLSALDQYDADDPPAWLRYEKSPPSTTSVVKLPGYVADGGEDQTNMQEADDCYARDSFGCLDAHHPNFGVELRRRATQKGSKNVIVQYAETSRSPALEAAAVDKFFANYYCFFIQYKPIGAATPIWNITPTANAARRNAVASYNLNWQFGDPPGGEESDCVLNEADGWNWN